MEGIPNPAITDQHLELLIQDWLLSNKTQRKSFLWKGEVFLFLFLM